MPFLFDGEDVPMTARHLLVGRDVIDARARRAAAQFMRKSLDGFAVALGDGLDVAVGQIPHPAAQAFHLRGLEHEEPESDALDATRDAEPARDDHLIAIVVAPAFVAAALNVATSLVSADAHFAASVSYCGLRSA